MSGGAAARLSAGQGTLTTAAPPAASSATASDLPHTAALTKEQESPNMQCYAFLCGGFRLPGNQLMAAASVTGHVRATNRSQDRAK